MAKPKSLFKGALYLEDKLIPKIAFVSIVIPTYNSVNSLTKTVESLYEQSYPKDKYEIIVVDDGSSDSTKQFIRELQNKSFGNLKYFFQKNKGPAAARNLGIKIASGDIVAFIDSDCVAEKNWVQEISKGYEADNVAGIGGRTKALPTASRVSRYCAYVNMNEKPEIDKTGIVHLITNNSSFKKEYLKQISGFDERYNFPGGEDIDLCYRLRMKGYIFKYNRNALVYTQHKESQGALLKTYFNYGKGRSFLTVSRLSNWDLNSMSGMKYLFYFLKIMVKSLIMLLGNVEFIVRFFKIPFKALMYYGEGVVVKDSLLYAFLDYAKELFFFQGSFFGYAVAKFKGFSKYEYN